jgi:hypothetical protein
MNEIAIIQSKIIDLSSKEDYESTMELDHIREQLNQLIISVESRIRRVNYMQVLPKISLGELPTWVDSKQLSTANKELNNLIVGDAICLLKSVGQEIPEGTIEQLPNSIQISWDAPRTFVWDIKTPTGSWPCVNVITYEQKQAGSPALLRKSFMSAHRLLQYTRRFFRG